MQVALKNENEISERLIELSSNLKSTIDNFIKNPKTPKPVNTKQNLLKETKKEIKAQRYVLLKKKRGIDNLDNSTIESITNRKISIENTELAINNYGDMNILDVVPSEIQEEDDVEAKKIINNPDRIMCNGVELLKEKISPAKQKNEYVYDIYYAKNQDIHLDLLYPSNFTINAFDLQLDENVKEDEEEFYEDDEDSNDEANWRNDYPDEDDDIDDEDDEDGLVGTYTYRDTGDYYNDYDEDGDSRLAAVMQKTCNLDRSYYEDDELSDDFDEYDCEESKTYSAYKRKLIKDLDK